MNAVQRFKGSVRSKGVPFCKFSKSSTALESIGKRRKAGGKLLTFIPRLNMGWCTKLGPVPNKAAHFEVWLEKTKGDLVHDIPFQFRNIYNPRLESLLDVPQTPSTKWSFGKFVLSLKSKSVRSVFSDRLLSQPSVPWAEVWGSRGNFLGGLHGLDPRR